MLRKFYKPTLALALCIAANTAGAQNVLNRDTWKDLDVEKANIAASATAKNLNRFRLVELNLDATRNWLKAAPMEFTPAAKAGNYIITLPTPAGDFMEFTIVESPMMEQGLADKYPSIKTYSAQGLQDKSMWAKIDITPLGFHAMVSSHEGVIFVDPVSLTDTKDYLVYYKHELKTRPVFSCGVNETIEEVFNSTEIKQNITQSFAEAGKTNSTEIQLRKYRLALAATAEYTKTRGNTIDGALAGQVVSMNRVNGVYETEVGIRMLLVNNNDKIIYTNATTDPYTNNDGATMLGQNVTNLNKVIGMANYDIGHVFSTGGGGIAGLGVPCTSGKARGVTGSPNPTGDAYDIDYVAHEMGHQFGGNHTFNSNSQGSCSGNRAANAAYEPGSGITVMAYAGICGNDDIAAHSIAYFHTKSLEEIMKFSQTGGGNGCAVKQPTGNFTPVAEAGNGSIIPKGTPFSLTGSGSDPDGDAITYSWEQYDLGTQGSPNSPTGDAPIFRPFAPTIQPTRVFPQWSDILAHKQTKGEIMPSYARRMHFRLTVRDNKILGGGTAYDTVSVQVIDSIGPFKVTSQKDSVEQWSEGEKKYITWNVNKTDLAPISCSHVDIRLSLDGGLTYPVLLADSVPNNGLDSIVVPGVNAGQARIMVKAHNNIFFDVNDKDIQVSAPGFTLSSTTGKQAICLTDTASYTITTNQFVNFADSIYLYADSVPAGASVLFSENNVPAPGTITVKVFKTGALAAGAYAVRIKALSGTKSDAIEFKLRVFNLTPEITTLIEPENFVTNQILKPLFRWVPLKDALTYNFELSTDAFATVDYRDSTITGNSCLFKNGFVLQYGIKYYWRVRGVNSCGKGDYSSTFEFTARNPVGIAESAAGAETINLYPNPVSGETFVIEISNGDQTAYQYKIYDLTGRLVKQDNHKITGNTTYTVNVSDLEQGVYLVKLVGQNGHEFTKKISIAR